MNEHPYNKYIKFIEGMSVAAKHLCALKYGDIDDDVIVDVPVSVDGSWQKRYGHYSMLGMVFVMSIDTGFVLDYINNENFRREKFRRKNFGGKTFGQI